MSEWNILDRFIAKIRYSKIEKYIPKNGTVCDIGCGQNADFLKKCSPYICTGYGFDYKIQTHKTGNLILTNSRLLNGTNLPDNCCDVVFMIALLEHLDNPEAVISEAHRILKKDGLLVLTTPTRFAKPILEFMAFRLHIINRDEILEHKHYYTCPEIFDLFQNNGFYHCKYKKFSFFVNSLATARKKEN